MDGEGSGVPEIRYCDDGDGDDDGVTRTGTLATCVFHIITTNIGSGVLSLAWSTAQLGWVWGPASMAFFAFVTYVSSFLLADCYRSPDSETGKRNKTYMDAVRVNLGKKQTWVCGFIQYLYLYGSCIAYTITTSLSVRAILRSNCYHYNGHDAPCTFKVSSYMLMFGVVEVVCSMIPDFHNLAWLSTVAAVMSFTYSSIAFALGFAKTLVGHGGINCEGTFCNSSSSNFFLKAASYIFDWADGNEWGHFNGHGNRVIEGNIYGASAPARSQNVWNISQAVGDIAFSFPYSFLLLEIQDTLKSPPAENKTMKKASVVSIAATTLFYLACGCSGYAAFGDKTPGNILTGFGFYEPFWLVDFANACIILHLVGAYQVYCQPIFAFVEQGMAKSFPSSNFVNKFYKVGFPFSEPCRLNFFRLCFRTLYVASTTGLGILFPYFNQVLGLLGGLNFWPLTLYFPVQMYLVQKKISLWSRKWVALQFLSVVCLMISLFASVGSVAGIIKEKLH